MSEFSTRVSEDAYRWPLKPSSHGAGEPVSTVVLVEHPRLEYVAFECLRREG